MPPTESVYLIRDYPIPDVSESVKVAGAVFGESEVKFKPFQIFLFASLVPKGTPLNQSARRFPILFDTGHNEHFSIDFRQLQDWMGLPWTTLKKSGETRIDQTPVPLVECDLWLYPCQRFTRQVDETRKPHRLGFDGIAVRIDERPPRVPLLGLRAVAANCLKIEINCREALKQFTLVVPPPGVVTVVGRR